jgi:hypothetical protein
VLGSADPYCDSAIRHIQILNLAWRGTRRHYLARNKAVRRFLYSEISSPDFLPKEKSNMKKRSLIPMMVFLMCFSLGAQAGQNTGAAHDQASDAREASKKATSMPGKVGSDGKTFTADKDSRIWMVSNPEALSGIDGRHVKVKAHVDTARNQIHIVSVSAIAEQRAGIKLDDAAFRR